MQKVLKGLLVFMASPSDLNDERQVLRTTEDELNHLFSGYGIRVRVVGWELTTPGYGRAQEQINPLVHECDVFIGLLNKRWGTATGNYSSGFEEEFEIALERRRNDEKLPAIGMFFSNISQEALSDPGPQLSKVIEFRNRVQAEQLALYGEFSNADQLGKRVMNFLLNQVLPFVTSTGSGPTALETTGTSPARNSTKESVSQDSEGGALNEAAEQIAGVFHGFMSAMEGNLGNGIELDFDRLALFARAVEHQPELLGTHLVNRLYRRLESFELTEVEAVAWLWTFFSDIGRSKTSEDRTVPGWALLHSEDASQENVERRLVTFAQHDDPNAARGALRVLTDFQLKPRALWQHHENNLNTSGEDPALESWSRIFGTLPGVDTALNYLLSQLQPSDAWLVQRLAKNPSLSQTARDTLDALEKTLSGDFSKLDSLRPYHFARDTDALVAYLALHINDMPLDGLGWLARFSEPNLRRAAIKRLLDENELKGPSLREAVTWNDTQVIQLLTSKAADDPAFGETALEVINDDRSKNFPRSLEPMLLATLRSTQELQALIDSSPLTYSHWEALSIQLGEAMLDDARRILDTDGAELRVALAPFAGEDRATVEFVVENFRASASVCVGNHGHGEEDAIRLAKEVNKGRLVSPALALVALSKIAKREHLSAIRGALPVLDQHSFVEDAELLMKTAIAPVLAEAWKSAETPSLQETARRWFICQPDRTSEELKEALHDDLPGVRMAALHALALRYSREQLKTLLSEYSSGPQQYWYNVIAAIDEILHRPAPLISRHLGP